MNYQSLEEGKLQCQGQEGEEEGVLVEQLTIQSNKLGLVQEKELLVQLGQAQKVFGCH